MLKITPAAADQIKEQIKQSDTEGLYLRIAAKTNQDGSFEYGMGFDESNDHDIKVNSHDLILVSDPQSAELLEDATLDYVEIEPGQHHFIFKNPIDPNYTPPQKG